MPEKKKFYPVNLVNYMTVDREKKKERGVGAPRPLLQYWTLMVVLVHIYKTLAAVKIETNMRRVKPDIKLKL